MPLLDTRQTGRDLTGTFVADLVLQILSYVAQTERENIKQRQKEGIAAAKLRGVQFGRPRKPLPDNFQQVKADWENKKITSREAAGQLLVAQDTFLRGFEIDKLKIYLMENVDFIVRQCYNDEK